MSRRTCRTISVDIDVADALYEISSEDLIAELKERGEKYGIDDGAARAST